MKYTKRQIQDAVSYWKRRLNESGDGIIKATFEIDTSVYDRGGAQIGEMTADQFHEFMYMLYENYFIRYDQISIKFKPGLQRQTAVFTAPENVIKEIFEKYQWTYTGDKISWEEYKRRTASQA